MKKGRSLMEVLVVVGILTLGGSLALFLIQGSGAYSNLVEQVDMLGKDQTALKGEIKAEIKQAKDDLYKIFDEHSKRLEILEITKPVEKPKRMVVKHVFPSAVPIEIVKRQTVPQAPKSLMQKAGLKRSQMKGM